MVETLTIGFYLENYAPGGLERLLFDLLASYSSSPYATVLFYAGDKDFPQRLRQENLTPSQLVWVPVLTTKPIEHWLWSKNPPRWIWRIFLGMIDLVRWLYAGLNIARCRKALAEHPIQSLHIVNGGYPASRSCLSAAMAARQIGLAHVEMTVTARPQARRWPLLERYFDHRMKSSCHKIVSNCQYLTDAMRVLRGFPESKLQTIYGGMAFGPGPSPEEVDAFGRKWSVSRPLLGSVAVLQHHKGHRYLLAALKELVRDFPSLCCLLVGDGAERRNLENAVRDLGLERHVRFTGQLAHFRTVMSCIDVFVHPSLEEGFPYVILEAMSLGKPIVATRVAGVPEQITDGESGLLVPPGEGHALAEALRTVLSDPARAQELGRRAKERSRLFSLDVMIPKFHALDTN